MSQCAEWDEIKFFQSKHFFFETCGKKLSPSTWRNETPDLRHIIRKTHTSPRENIFIYFKRKERSYCWCFSDESNWIKKCDLSPQSVYVYVQKKRKHRGWNLRKKRILMISAWRRENIVIYILTVTILIVRGLNSSVNKALTRGKWDTFELAYLWNLLFFPI